MGTDLSKEIDKLAKKVRYVFVSSSYIQENVTDLTMIDKGNFIVFFKVLFWLTRNLQPSW